MRCPTCGSDVCDGIGVRLPALKAQLVARIRAAGDLGVSSRELVREVYRDRPRRPRLVTIKAHVHQVNDLLEATAWRIRSDRRRWYLERRGGVRQSGR